MYEKAQISKVKKDLPMQLPAKSVWFQSSILCTDTKITSVAPRCSLIKFCPGHADQNNKCSTAVITDTVLS